MSGKSQVNVANVHFHKTKVLEELINCVSNHFSFSLGFTDQ